MEKVLNITDRLRSKRRKEEQESFRLKFNSIQRIVQCASCHFRCAMCGQHVAPSDPHPAASPTPQEVNLCVSCRAEFEDFLDMVSGNKGNHMFWHNEEWMDLWSTWLDYREAIRKFRNSPEYKQLITEPEG
jgi:hypothetical protein